MPHLPCIFGHMPTTGAYNCFINLENIYNMHTKSSLNTKICFSFFYFHLLGGLPCLVQTLHLLQSVDHNGVLTVHDIRSPIVNTTSLGATSMVSVSASLAGSSSLGAIRSCSPSYSLFEGPSSTGSPSRLFSCSCCKEVVICVVALPHLPHPHRPHCPHCCPHLQRTFCRNPPLLTSWSFATSSSSTPPHTPSHTVPPICLSGNGGTFQRSNGMNKDFVVGTLHPHCYSPHCHYPCCHHMNQYLPHWHPLCEDFVVRIHHSHRHLHPLCPPSPYPLQIFSAS